ncbi:MAG: sigma-70 family RNA polymerase sigma factor [Chloroflexota bacterium]|nr:sigma-70 family RNA polymerase sigma factor [Chloroflexota bacterium]
MDWERLYRTVYPSVYRALVATLLNADLASDALQDAFLAGLERPPLHDANVAGWLFRVAVRKAARAGRRPTLRLADARTVVSDRSHIDALLDRLSVGQLLRLLSERQRSIVVAYFYLDQSQEQIAELLGIRRGTVAATISQALARMRKGEGHVQ